MDPLVSALLSALFGGLLLVAIVIGIYKYQCFKYKTKQKAINSHGHTITINSGTYSANELRERIKQLMEQGEI